MKKNGLSLNGLLLLILIPVISYAQNTFPSSGNVGIGTLSPSSDLDVTNSTSAGVAVTIRNTNSGSATLSGLRVGNNVAVNRLELFTLASGYIQAGPYYPDGSSLANEGAGGLSLGALNSSGMMRFYTGGNGNNNERIRISNDGKVGIGNTNPMDVLDVNGTIRSRTGAFTLNNGTVAGGLYFHKNIVGTGSDLSPTLFAETGNSLYFMTGGSAEVKAVIGSNGNFGIGTATPDSKLTVAGKIHSQEVKVTATAGADFVFEEDYKLRSLSDTENFIKANKHLPEIASADEMKKNGIQLGEMNIKLLQKIEELTLHLIEQNKEIKEQRTMIKDLQGIIQQKFKP